MAATLFATLAAKAQTSTPPGADAAFLLGSHWKYIGGDGSHYGLPDTSTRNDDCLRGTMFFSSSNQVELTCGGGAHITGYWKISYSPLHMTQLELRDPMSTWNFVFDLYPYPLPTKTFKLVEPRPGKIAGKKQYFYEKDK